MNKKPDYRGLSFPQPPPPPTINRDDGTSVKIQLKKVVLPDPDTFLEDVKEKIANSMLTLVPDPENYEWKCRLEEVGDRYNITATIVGPKKKGFTCDD